ncbi:protein PRRC1-A-like isoform X1 [Dreissena polymorpha]|nr:protein PRRC1-A-like isoform X1 [Dreissena polymorpha]
MMMEESSDESAELVDKEEAVTAEKQFTAQQTGSGTNGELAPPAPLPSFITSPGNLPSMKAGSPPPTTPTNVPQSVNVTMASTGAGPTHSPGSPGPVGGQATSSSQGLQSSASFQQVTAPGPQQSPFEASSAINVITEPETDISVLKPNAERGLFSWLSGNRMISKVMEKTKSSVESMITTLDPGMTEVIKSGGDVCIVVTSTAETKVGAVREAFQTVFGKATVYGKASTATTAAQPVGFTSGVKGAQERIQNLRQSASIPDNQPIVSLEGFIVEMLPDRWYELSCLILQDPVHRIDLQTFSQPAPIPAEYILKIQDQTDKDYPLRWSGFSVTVGQVIEEACPHIGHTDWQLGVTGVSRRESLCLAAKALAYMYKQRLPTSFES